MLKYRALPDFFALASEKRHIEQDREKARNRLLVFLSFLTSPESQKAHVPLLPPETLAYELCRIWFDEVFVPGIRYLEGIKGDRDEEAALAFRASFTDEEWKYVERFHRFLELRIDMIPESHRDKRQVPQNNLWESVVRDARYLLELLEPNRKKRQYLAGAVNELALIGR